MLNTLISEKYREKNDEDSDKRVYTCTQKDDCKLQWRCEKARSTL